MQRWYKNSKKCNWAVWSHEAWRERTVQTRLSPEKYETIIRTINYINDYKLFINDFLSILLFRALLCLIVISLSAASVHSLATPIGSLLSGVFIDAVGRRNSLQLAAIPLCIGWLVIGFSRNVTVLLVGRFICGISVGTMAVPAQVRDYLPNALEMMLSRRYSSTNGFPRARRILRRFIDPYCTNNLL